MISISFTQTVEESGIGKQSKSCKLTNSLKVVNWQTVQQLGNGEQSNSCKLANRPKVQSKKVGNRRTVKKNSQKVVYW